MSFTFFDVKNEIQSFNGLDDDDDDILDAIVNITANERHYTDEELNILLQQYKNYQLAFKDGGRNFDKS